MTLSASVNVLALVEVFVSMAKALRRVSAVFQDPGG